MEFNPSKCEAITFTKKTKPVEMEYKLHDTTLAAVSSAKYLGVYVNNKLSWNTHVDVTAKKATQSLNFILVLSLSKPRFKGVDAGSSNYLLI